MRVGFCVSHHIMARRIWNFDWYRYQAHVPMYQYSRVQMIGTDQFSINSIIKVSKKSEFSKTKYWIHEKVDRPMMRLIQAFFTRNVTILMWSANKAWFFHFTFQNHLRLICMCNSVFQFASIKIYWAYLVLIISNFLVKLQ